jgi:hypothetical protein
LLHSVVEALTYSIEGQFASQWHDGLQRNPYFVDALWNFALRHGVSNPLSSGK